MGSTRVAALSGQTYVLRLLGAKSHGCLLHNVPAANRLSQGRLRFQMTRHSKRCLEATEELARLLGAALADKRA